MVHNAVTHLKLGVTEIEAMMKRSRIPQVVKSVRGFKRCLVLKATCNGCAVNLEVCLCRVVCQICCGCLNDVCGLWCVCHCSLCDCGGKVCFGLVTLGGGSRSAKSSQSKHGVATSVNEDDESMAHVLWEVCTQV